MTERLTEKRRSTKIMNEFSCNFVVEEGKRLDRGSDLNTYPGIFSLSLTLQ